MYIFSICHRITTYGTTQLPYGPGDDDEDDAEAAPNLSRCLEGWLDGDGMEAFEGKTHT